MSQEKDIAPSVILETVPDAARLRDHWWWRPGWALGSRRLAWHFTFEGQQDLDRLVGAYQLSLQGFETLHLVPGRWLHLTLVDVGPTADVTDENVAAMVGNVQSAVAHLPSVRLAFPRLVLLAESSCLFPEPVDRLEKLRDAVADSVRQALPGWSDAGHLLAPHMSLAYANGPQDGAAVLAALASVDARPAIDVTPTLSLIEIHRDDGRYEWRTLATC